MKNLNLLAILALSAGGVARADYHCKSTDASLETSMTVKEKHLTHLGNASVTLVAPSGETIYYGNIGSQDGDLFKKTVMELYPYQGDMLTIVSSPKICGRGSCNYDPTSIVTANLKIGETLTYFSCDATNP